MFYCLRIAVTVLLLPSSFVHVASFISKSQNQINLQHVQGLKHDLASSATFERRKYELLMLNTIQEDISEIIKRKKPQLPPLPENKLVLGGDVLALFLYSFMDHSLNYFTDQATKESTEASIVGLHATWLDYFHLPTEFVTATTQMPNLFQYSPALQQAGICSVTITTLWLISAYFNEAFSYENTVYNSESVILITGKSWLYTAAGMIAIALASDSMICGCPLYSHVGHLTKCDADYIFDSIGVLLSWRYMVSLILKRL
mmetsp:Transcript_45863/g.53659  ORF Transcript_45863/g.53659 Transcript_45863/m.53659 type:complete len:259 (+) Transcript_45863:119-895(+)